jgi:sugar phosphate permease
MVATSLATWSVVFWHHNPIAPNWLTPGYILPAAVTLLSAILFMRALRGLPPERDARPLLGTQSKPAPDVSWRFLLRIRSIRTIAVMYFFLKMMRYALLFWLPVYLMNNLGYSAQLTAGMASCFEIFGFLGAILLIRAATVWFANRYFWAAACFLTALAFVCLLHPVLSQLGWGGALISISLMGLLIHGTDLLMSGVAVLELTPTELHGRAVGLVNAVGSVGQTISALVVVWSSRMLGWTWLFNLFVVCAIVCAVVCLRERRAGVPLTGDRTVLNVLMP